MHVHVCIIFVFRINIRFNHAEESLSAVQDVTITRSEEGSSPALRVSWSAASAVSSSRQGSYSDRVQRNACKGKWFVWYVTLTLCVT